MSDESVRTGEGSDSVQGGTGPHQVENLDDLAAEGKRLESGAAPAAPGAPPAEVDQPATLEDIVDMLAIVRETAAPAAEEAGLLPAALVTSIWNDDALRRIARPLLTIMQRRGLTFGEAFDKWGPYAMLAAGIVGPAFATWRAIRDTKTVKPADATA